MATPCRQLGRHDADFQCPLRTSASESSPNVCLGSCPQIQSSEEAVTGTCGRKSVGGQLLGFFRQRVLDGELMRNGRCPQPRRLCPCPCLVTPCLAHPCRLPQGCHPHTLCVKLPNLGGICVLLCISCFPCLGWFSGFEGAELSLLCHLQSTNPLLWKAASGCSVENTGPCAGEPLRSPGTS